MALDHNAANRKIVVSSAAPLEGMTEFSMLVWVKLLAASAKDDGVLYREDSGGALVYRLIMDDTSGNMQFFVNRAGGGGFKVSSSLGLTVGDWKCVAVSFDATNHTDIFIGDLSTSLAAPTLSTDVDGAGAMNTNNGLFTIGNSEDNQATRFFTGSIAVVKHFDKRLTLQQLIAEQWGNANLVDRNYYAELGYSGTSTQVDWSRNANNGTITGGTIADHVPLRMPFGFDAVNMPFAVAAAGRIMGGLAGLGGLAGMGGLAGPGGGLAR